MSFNISKTPDSPGVYLLKNKTNNILYIGKAISLKKRLKAYKKPTNDPKTNLLINSINKVETFEVESEIEALVLEANLIKKNQPEFNNQLKDDKDYLYIIITSDKYPKLLPARKRSISESSEYFGPFPSASSVRNTLKALRKIFPFSTCKPGSRKACLYYHLGLCPGVCIGTVNLKEYKQNIRNIKLFLQGKKQKIIEDLKDSMEKASSDLRYEDASGINKKLKSMEYIQQRVFDVTRYIDNPEFLKLNRLEELRQLQGVLGLNKLPNRIEGYDISNIRGEFATGSMVVFINGSADKSSYRKFKIKTVRGISDTDMLEEILIRRFNNNWAVPNLIIVDGGRGQLSTCIKILRGLNLSIPCAALAKKNEQIYLPNRQSPINLPSDSKALHLVQRLRDEAHRFAISYHKHLRKEALTLQIK